MIRNEQGQIAIAYRQPIPHVVKVNGTNYLFDVKSAVSMAWINEGDVEEILRIIKVCCGGNKTNTYHHATDGQVNVWSGKGR